MTKKHFIRLAEVIQNMEKQGWGLCEAQIDDLARFCKEFNSQFMKDRWVGYIKGENGKCGGKVK